MRSRRMPVMNTEASRVVAREAAKARLVVDAQAPVALQAAEGLLNLPVAGLGPEPLAARGADVSGRPRGGGRRSALPHPKKEGH